MKKRTLAAFMLSSSLLCAHGINDISREFGNRLADTFHQILQSMEYKMGNRYAEMGIDSKLVNYLEDRIRTTAIDEFGTEHLDKIAAKCSARDLDLIYDFTATTVKKYVVKLGNIMKAPLPFMSDEKFTALCLKTAEQVHTAFEASGQLESYHSAIKEGNYELATDIVKKTLKGNDAIANLGMVLLVFFMEAQDMISKHFKEDLEELEGTLFKKGALTPSCKSLIKGPSAEEEL
ncbi:MAG: hypothetical protein V4534_06490 [Myxococcota bacterium]